MTATTAKPQADVAEIRRAFNLLTVPGGVVEIRGVKVPGQGKPHIVGGYFTDLDKAAQAAATLDTRKAGGVYIVLNEIDPALLARSPNQLTEYLDPTTSDSGIIRRRWLPLDFDAARPAGISASEDEHCEAEDSARRCAAWLSSLDWPLPIAADSGNGAHVLYRVDLPTDDGGLVQRCLQALARRCDSEAVHVDQTVYNPARIWKLYGTTARKGHSTADRPHRLARLVEVPESLEIVSTAKLEALAAMIAEPAPMPSTNGNGQYDHRLDVPKWLAARGVGFKVKGRPGSDGRTIYLLENCPFDASHVNGEAKVMQWPDGKLGASCFHNSCSGRGWRQFKEAIGPPEPEHYNPPLTHQGNGQGDDVNNCLQDGKPAAAVENVKHALQDGKPKEPRFKLITSAALDREDYTPCPIITEALFADSPHFIGGLFKSCKTLLAVAGAVAIASGRPFLDTFTVARPMKVLYFTGEGGPSVAQDYGRRVARSHGLELCEIENLSWCFTLPRLENLSDLDEFARVLDDTGPGVVALDNTTLCVPGDRAGVVFSMGQLFANVIRLCTDRGTTPIFVHHFKRNRADQFAPGELSDLTQAGAAEIAGQWWLLTRREAYDPDQAGEHRLWLSIGGRVGHSSLHALDVHEGRRTDPGGRRWEVELQASSEARRAAQDAQQAARDTARQAKAEADLQADRREIVGTLAKLKGTETKSGLRARAPFGHGRFDRAFASLAADGTLRAEEIRKGNGQTYESWRLRREDEA
jgi:hypothetical protein